MQTRAVTTPEQAAKLAEWLVGLTVPFTLTVKEGRVRSLDQNALLHKWYGEIAAQSGDMTAAQVKGQAHVAFGVPIKMRDPIWARVWQKMFAPLTYEQQCFLFSHGILSMTRDMTTKELKEYLDAMAEHYRSQNFRLTEPEE